MKLIALLLCALATSGCAVSLYTLGQSLDAYKTCLQSQLGDCERERKIYEADLAAYRAVIGGGTAVFVAPVIPPAPR